MEITELTLKIILLLIPGAIAGLIIEQLTIHTQWSSFKFIVGSVILGCISYCLLQLIFQIPLINPKKEELTIWTSITNAKAIPYCEIIYSSMIAIILGFFVTFIIQNKCIFKIAQRLKISSKFGDESLYYFFLSAKEITEVYVRDYEQDLTFHGYVQSYSESKNQKELVLFDVDVYSLGDSTKLYNSDAIFLSKSNEASWQIELPTYNKNISTNGKTNKSKPTK